MAHRGRSEGFTLIELMIVVGIVSVLASAAIPVFQRYVRRARNLEGLHNIEKLADSAVAYYEAHSRMPYHFETQSWFNYAEAPFPGGPHWGAYCQNLVWPAAASAEFNQGAGARVWNAVQFQPEGNLRFIYAFEVIGGAAPPWVDSVLYAYRFEYAGCAFKDGHYGMYYETRLRRAADGLLHPLGPAEKRW